MASTADRIRKLVADNLEVDGKPLPEPLDFSTGLTALGVSSMDVVAFAKVIQDEFGLQFTPEQCAELTSLSALVEFLDARAA